MTKSKCFTFVAWASFAWLGFALPAQADISAFVSAVGFDKDANLNGSPGLGVRWGNSSRLIGGEASLMVAFPEREIGGIDVGSIDNLVGQTKGTTATIFYEGRLLVNIPVVVPIKPFVGVGWGAITTTSTDVDPVPTEVNGVAVPAADLEKAGVAYQALKAVSKVRTNMAFSYGAGARYEVGQRLAIRADLRQYAVPSVKGLAAAAVEDKLEGTLGEDVKLEKEKTALYNELSIGLSIKF